VVHLKYSNAKKIVKKKLFHILIALTLYISAAMNQAIVRICTILALLFSPLFSLIVLSHENETDPQSICVSCEKTYVLLEQIHIHPNEILIKINDEWFVTESLHSDIEGLYIQNFSPESHGCADPYVSCRNCKRCVYEAWDICPYCGKPI
jgi:hypothetical protein